MPARRVGQRSLGLRFPGQWRDPAVRWIDNQRRAIVEFPLDHLEGAAGRGRAFEAIDIGERSEIDRVSRGKIGVGVLEETIGTPSQLGDFLVGERRPSFEQLRTFERRRAVVQPHALEVGMAIGTDAGRTSVGRAHPAGHGACLSHNGRRAANQSRQGYPQCERPTAHGHLRAYPTDLTCDRPGGVYATTRSADQRCGSSIAATVGAAPAGTRACLLPIDCR